MTKSIDIENIKHLRATISENIILTPVIRFKALERLFSKNTKIYTKLEFLQKTGTFKIRGALTSLIKLDSTQKNMVFVPLVLAIMLLLLPKHQKY